MESAILEGLNPAQRDAVVNYEANSLIIAGAGSGKTRVLTSRIAYMIEQGVAPDRILALTFTNKAAEQMRSRIDAIVGRRSRWIRMGTFHSVFSRMLRENAELLGYPQAFTIYDTNDCKHLIKQIIKDMNLGDDRYKPGSIAARISLFKNDLITPGAYAARSVHAAEDRQKQIPEFGNIYAEYCRRCKQNGAMDFDDLLLQTNILLRDRPDVLARYQEQFRYILVDEYQDTNYAQYIIVRRLSLGGARVCVVGDDAQSIYSFRGAKIENILSFRKDYPDALTFKLEQNYRSTQTIVDAANSVIEHNARRMEKRCFSAGDRGEKIRVMQAYTDREEAEMVVDALSGRIRRSGDEWSEAAVLYRTNQQSLVIEEAMRRRGIPYRIYKGNSFYEHKEIKDLLAYIRLIINPRDDEAFRRIINVPARGIGDTTVQRIAEIAAQRGVSMWEAVDTLTGETPADARQRAIIRKAGDFVELLRSMSTGRYDKSLYEFGHDVASRSGLMAMYRAQDEAEDSGALDNIEELLNSMQLFTEQRNAEIRAGERADDQTATVEEWLQGVMLMTDMDNDNPEDRNRVTLMTVHSAKGLEYKYVYIVGLEENLFPSSRAAESPEGIEEERRLFYVALTRAKVAAVLSYAQMRMKWGTTEFTRPSLFLREIDSQYVEGDVDDERPVRVQAAGEGRSAIDELRRRFDYRFRQGGGAQERGPRPVQGRQQGAYFGGRQGSGGGDRSPRMMQQQAGSRPSMFEHQMREPAPQRSTEGMRSVGIRQQRSDSAPVTAGTCPYAVGERVEHPKFGAGEVVRIETLAGDHKVVVRFGDYGEKTLLAKFAKLTKL